MLRLPQLQRSLPLKRFLSDAYNAAEMEQLPSIENWLRFKAEQRYIKQRVDGLQERTQRSERRRSAARLRVEARSRREERWAERELPRCEARIRSIEARLPRQREMGMMAEARRALQARSRRLLLLRPAYEPQAQAADATARAAESAGREELVALRETWAATAQLEARALHAEEVECEEDQASWHVSEFDWLVLHGSWRPEVQRELLAPSASDLLQQRRTLQEGLLALAPRLAS